jgi:hypothetical protein
MLETIIVHASNYVPGFTKSDSGGSTSSRYICPSQLTLLTGFENVCFKEDKHTDMRF